MRWVMLAWLIILTAVVGYLIYYLYPIFVHYEYLKYFLEWAAEYGR